MRFSKQRQEIFDLLQGCQRKEHPTADQVYTQIRQQDPTISLGTVYRNLNQLAQAGLIRRIEMPNRSDRYDGCVEEHYHLYCQRCGKVSDIKLSCLQNLDEEVQRDTGFRIQGHHLLIEGICKDCLSIKK